MFKKLFKLAIISSILSLSFLGLSCKHSDNNSDSSKEELLDKFVYYDTAYKTKFTSGDSYFTFSKGNKLQWKKNDKIANISIKEVSGCSYPICTMECSFEGKTQRVYVSFFDKTYIVLHKTSGSIFNNPKDIVYIYQGTSEALNELLADKITYDKEYVYIHSDPSANTDIIKFEKDNVLTLKSTYDDGIVVTGSFKIMNVVYGNNIYGNNNDTISLRLVQTDSSRSFYYNYSTIDIAISEDKNSFTLKYSSENSPFQDLKTDSTFSIR